MGKRVRSASFLPFCCRRTPLVGARCGQTSAAWNSAGSEAFVAGRSLWTHSFTACAIPSHLSFRFLSAAGALLCLVLAVAKRARPLSALYAKLFLRAGMQDRCARFLRCAGRFPHTSFRAPVLGLAKAFAVWLFVLDPGPALPRARLHCRSAGRTRMLVPRAIFSAHNLSLANLEAAPAMPSRVNRAAPDA